MPIEALDQSKIYQPNSSANAGGDDGATAFMKAIKSPLLPPALVRQQDVASPPNGNSSPSQTFSALARSIYDPSSSAGDDDVTKLDDAKEASLKQMDTIVNSELTPDGSASAAPGQPSSPADNLTALQNGTATGSPPDDLTLPPGTTAADVAGMNGGLLNNLNKGHVNSGAGAGDAAAQMYGYKDMKTLLADPSPAAAAAAGKILWAARACNNLTEADGAPRPADEQSANTLGGVDWKHRMVTGGSANVFQSWIEKGTPIAGQHVFATSRTHADGSALSHGQYIGHQIAGFFKKVFSFICPPISDLIQMAEDGSEKIRDQHVGDKDAASHDEAAIKKDGKNFGTDFAELAANAALDVVAPEAEVGVKVAEEAAETGAKAGAKEATKAAESGSKDVASAARDVEPAGGMLDASSLTNKLKDLMFGDDFKSKLTGLPKHATRKEKEDYVKEKVEDHLNDLLQQLAPPPNGNQKTAQGGESASDQAELLAQLAQIHSALASAQASGSQPGSGNT
jgi:hypothetical protein